MKLINDVGIYKRYIPIILSKCDHVTENSVRDYTQRVHNDCFPCAPPFTWNTILIISTKTIRSRFGKCIVRIYWKTIYNYLFRVPAVIAVRPLHIIYAHYIMYNIICCNFTVVRWKPHGWIDGWPLCFVWKSRKRTGF